MCKLFNIEEAPCTGWDKRIEDLLVTYKGEDISRKEPTETEQR